MLEVIGAGATASSAINWYETWKNSKEATQTQSEIENIHSEGRKKPPVQATRKSEFATSWTHQAILLTQRAFSAYWRDPTYLIAKLVLNIVSGLFIGFTFFKSKDTMQGTQNKLFVSKMFCVKNLVRSLIFFLYTGDLHEHDSYSVSFEPVASCVHPLP